MNDEHDIDRGVMAVAKGNTLTACVALLTVIAVSTALQAAQTVVLPLFIAWLLSFILGPVVNFMTVRRIPVWAAVTVVMVLLGGVCYLGGMFVLGRVIAFADRADLYQEQLKVIITDIMQKWNVKPEMMLDINWAEPLVAALRGGGKLVANFGVGLLKVVFFLIFLLLGKPFFKYKLRKAFADNRAGKIDEVVSSIATQIGKYLSVQFLISFVTGLCVWFVLYLLKIDFAVTWGALAFLLNFIPTLGSIVATVPPVLLALVQNYPDMWPAVMTLICLTAIQITIGNIVAPKVMGDSLNLSPVMVLVSLIFWGWLWGIAGALISVPIAVAIRIVCDNIEYLQPIGVMMGSGKIYSKELQ